MIRCARHLPALFLVLLPLGAAAQIYVCKDASGRTMTSDRPIPECANRAVRELDRNGLTRREIAAPLTAEQRHERDLLEEKKRLDAAAAAEQRLYDRALMTRYRNEQDIASARERALALLHEQMRIDNNGLAAEAREFKAAQVQNEAAVVSKKINTAAERRRLDDANNAVKSRLASIERRNAEIERTNQRFDLALKRFQELTR